MLHPSALRPVLLVSLVTLGIAACSSDSALESPLERGGLEISIVTIGAHMDPDGYTVRVDSQEPVAIGVAATMDADVTPGDHSVQLAGLAANCAMAGENPQTVSVAAGDTVALEFAVSCPAPPSSSWMPMASGTTKDFLYVSGTSAARIFAAAVNLGCDTTFCGEVSILHYDGAGWTTQFSHTGSVLGLWAAPDGNAFALAGGYQPGPILYYDGHQWSAMAVQPPPPPDPDVQDVRLDGVWGTSSSDVYAVGSWYTGTAVDGYAVHYNGTGWTRVDLGNDTFIRLAAVWGSSPSDVYAVGQYVPYDSKPEEQRGVILHYDGHTWSEVLREAGLALGHVWGTSATDVYATGSSGPNGSVWHYDGHAWSPMQLPVTTPLQSIWGSSSSDIYVLGREPGKIWHYDGSGWAQIDTGAGEILEYVWGASGSDVFAVGHGGTILHGP